MRAARVTICKIGMPCMRLTAALGVLRPRRLLQRQRALRAPGTWSGVPLLLTDLAAAEGAAKGLLPGKDPQSA